MGTAGGGLGTQALSRGAGWGGLQLSPRRELPEGTSPLAGWIFSGQTKQQQRKAPHLDFHLKSSNLHL